MRRLGPALALLLVASVALANPGDARVSVTLKADVVDVHAAGEEMVAIYGGRLIETNAQTVVLEISIARSGLVARDPRVASVTVLGSASSQPHAAAARAPRPLAPRANNNDPCTTAPIGLPRCTGTYQYDGAGNIKAIGNDVFVYDAVSRLKSATLASAGGVGESYDYDAFGNLKKITAATPADLRPDLTTDPLTNHLKTVTTAKYDEAGNLTSWMGHEYTYDAANMLTEMNDGVADMMYVYTADDERIATLTVSNSGYVATWRIRGLDDKVLREFQEENYSTSTQPWAWKRDYVYRGDLLLASYVTSPTGTTKRLDYHLDHLGTPRLITDDAGQQVSVHHYYPFGREITSAAGETLKFTGHERDFAPYDYQDYMHARYDNPYLGRFLSVDSELDLKKAARAPQMWNRYAYVTNNPMRYTDPDGRDMHASDYLGAVWEATKQTIDDLAYDVAEPGLTVMSGFINDDPKEVAKGSGILFVEGATGGLASANVSRLTMGFTSRANLLAHFEKHGAEMGFRMAEAYGAAGSKFASTAGREGVQSVVTKTGEKYIYNASTKEFAVVNKGGKVITYYKANVRYWASTLKKLSEEIVASSGVPK